MLVSQSVSWVSSGIYLLETFMCVIESSSAFMLPQIMLAGESKKGCGSASMQKQSAAHAVIVMWMTTYVNMLTTTVKYDIVRSKVQRIWNRKHWSVLRLRMQINFLASLQTACKGLNKVEQIFFKCLLGRNKVQPMRTSSSSGRIKGITDTGLFVHRLRGTLLVSFLRRHQGVWLIASQLSCFVVINVQRSKKDVVDLIKAFDTRVQGVAGGEGQRCARWRWRVGQ